MCVKAEGDVYVSLYIGLRTNEGLLTPGYKGSGFYSQNGLTRITGNQETAIMAHN